MDFTYVLNHEPILAIGSFFDEAQRHKNGHAAIISSLYKLCRKSDLKIFTLEFLQCLSSAFVQKEKSSYAIIALEFAAKFCCHYTKNIPEDVEDVFLKCIVKFVTKIGDSKPTVVRLRVCEFISLFLSSMSTEATIDEEVFETVTQCMIDRTKDKLPTVRMHAFAALQRLQDPQDNTCPVTKAFIFHLECDPSAEVRKHILKNIAITQHSLPAVISRSRDFSEIVRKEMYQTICKIKSKRLRIRHRQELLTNGLNDSSEVVRDHVLKKLVPTWFDECERDYLKLLELFYIETYSLETVTSLLVSLFKRRASADLLDIIKCWQTPEKVIPQDDLTTEKTFMWLSVVKYFRNPPSGVTIDQEDVFSILPSLTLFAKYVKEYSIKVINNDTTAEYIFMRLLDLVFQFSLDDEKGREEMVELCRDMLLSKEVESEELVKLLARLITLLKPDVNDRLEMIALIISDIQHPLEDDRLDDDSDLVENSIENLRIDDTVASSNVDGVEFSNIKMLPKCLFMLIEILKSKDIDYLHPVLDTLQGTFLHGCFSLGNSYVSSLALSALSLLCLKSEAFAKANFIKFLYTLESDALELSSLEAIFDQLIFYGFDVCQLSVDKANDIVPNKQKNNATSLDFYDDPTISKTSMKHLLNRLSSCLFSAVVQIRSVASQGLAKLLLTNCIHSSFVLAKLVILWFSSKLGSDSCVSQPLGIFFDLYSRKISNSGDVILNTLIPSLEYLTYEDCDHNFIGVDPLRVANLLLNTLKNAQAPEEGGSFHFRAANLICDEILNRSIRTESQICTILTKCFYHLDIQKSDKEYADDLLEKLPVVLSKIDKLKEKSVRKIAISFYSKLNTLWGVKGTNNSSLTAASQLKKVNKPVDDTCLNLDNENSLLNGSANITIRRSQFSRSKISEPLIEEYSDSDDEKHQNGSENGDVLGTKKKDLSDHSSEDQIIPGTSESEDSESASDMKPPPSRRKQRRLDF